MNLEDSVSSSTSSNDRSCVSPKKRGVVRQMVREIEKGVRKLTGKSTKTEKKAKAAKPESFTKPERSGIFSPEKGKHYAVPATDSRDDNPSGSEASFSKPPTPGIDLVTPTPYRTPDTKRAISPSKERFKLSVTVPRVRRTQSERAVLKPQTFKKPGYFRSFKATESNLVAKQSLPTECTSNTIEETDGSSVVIDSFRRRSSSGDASSFVMSLPYFRTISSPQLAVSSQAASATSSQQNVIPSQSTDQVRT